MGKDSMAVSYTDAKAEVEGLIARFARLSARNRKRYNEPATRQEFILPLFRTLGWNIENTREVSPEERVSRGFVDFAFRLSGIPRFFLETKKIPENLEDPRWAHQAINYAWLKGVTWAVLSDFRGAQGLQRRVAGDHPRPRYLQKISTGTSTWIALTTCGCCRARRWRRERSIKAAEAVGKKVKKTPVSRLLFADLNRMAARALPTPPPL